MTVYHGPLSSAALYYFVRILISPVAWLYRRPVHVSVSACKYAGDSSFATRWPVHSSRDSSFFPFCVFSFFFFFFFETRVWTAVRVTPEASALLRVH